MSSFYHCYTPTSSNRGYPTTTLPAPVQDLKSALDCIKKAALTVSDLSLKLQLKQVTNFLESDAACKLKQGIIEPTSLKRSHQIQPNYAGNYLESKICVCLPSYSSQEKPGMENISIAVKRPVTVYPFENDIECQTAKSLLLGKISQSAVSKELMESSMREPSQAQTLGEKQRQREKSDRDKQNDREETVKEDEWKISSSQGMSGFGKVLKWRSVVTRNALEEHDTNKKVCFVSQSGRIDHSSESDRTNSLKLQDENKQLKQGLLEIISCLQQKKIMKDSIDLPIGQLLAYVQKCCEQLKENQQHAVSMRSFKEQEQCAFFKIQESKKDVQERDNQIQHLQCEISKMGDQLQKSRLECEKLREIATARAEELKKYELLLFVKEEQLASLKVMVESHQKKSISSVPTSPSGRTYKKYFQHLESNFTAMNNFSSTN